MIWPIHASSEVFIAFSYFLCIVFSVIDDVTDVALTSIWELRQWTTTKPVLQHEILHNMIEKVSENRREVIVVACSSGRNRTWFSLDVGNFKDNLMKREPDQNWSFDRSN